MKVNQADSLIFSILIRQFLLLLEMQYIIEDVKQIVFQLKKKMSSDSSFLKSISSSALSI